MLNFKIIIGFAAFALVISLIGGMAGAVPIGTAALRVLLGVVVFAGLGAGVSWLIKKFLPDLAQQLSNGTADKGSDDVTTGVEVDIVLPEENPHVAVGTPGGRTPADVADAESMENLADDPGDSGLDSEFDGSGFEGVDPSLSGSEAAEDNEVVYGEEEEAMSDLGGGSQENVGTSETINVMGQEQDAAITAKAIQTWLRKDQEG